MVGNLKWTAEGVGMWSPVREGEVRRPFYDFDISQGLEVGSESLMSSHREITGGP